MCSRSQCEELRSILSKRLQDQITYERFQQVAEKQRREEQQRVDDAMYAQLWYEDIRTKAQREEEEERKKIRANQEMVEVLQKQMAAVEAHKQMEDALVAEEAQLLVSSLLSLACDVVRLSCLFSVMILSLSGCFFLSCHWFIFHDVNVVYFLL